MYASITQRCMDLKLQVNDKVIINSFNRFFSGIVTEITKYPFFFLYKVKVDTPKYKWKGWVGAYDIYRIR